MTKRPDASTLTVVRERRNNLARFQSLVPEDVKITYEFDRSTYVRAAMTSVLREATIGALLTGLTLLLFLRDWRSSLIVVITIPFALLTTVVFLKLTGQTIDIMTLVFRSWRPHQPDPQLRFIVPIASKEPPHRRLRGLPLRNDTAPF